MLCVIFPVTIIQLKEKKPQILLLGMGGMTYRYVGRGRRIGKRGRDEGLGIEGDGGVREEG